MLKKKKIKLVIMADCYNCSKSFKESELVWSEEWCGKVCQECYDEEESEDEESEDEEEEERFCDNENCPYEGYCYGSVKKELEGKPYICVGCETGKGLQEREQEEKRRCPTCDAELDEEYWKAFAFEKSATEPNPVYCCPDCEPEEEIGCIQNFYVCSKCYFMTRNDDPDCSKCRATFCMMAKSMPI